VPWKRVKSKLRLPSKHLTMRKRCSGRLSKRVRGKNKSVSIRKRLLKMQRFRKFKQLSRPLLQRVNLQSRELS